MTAAAPKRAHTIQLSAAALLFVLGCAGPSGSDPTPAPDQPNAALEAESQASRDRPEPPSPSESEAPDRSPAATLEGDEWVVVELEGQPLLERSRISLEFGDDRLLGDASCNRYAAEWTRPAPGRIRIGPARATLRACAPAVMDQERRFLELLDRFDSMTITADDVLVLETDDGEELRATRS